MENPTPIIERKKKPTIRQRKAARLIADTALGKTGYKTDKEIVTAAGYSDSVREVPGKVLETSGVMEALDELGFTSENAKKVVQKILNNEEAEHRDRLKAADMVFKVKGDYVADQNIKENNANPIIYAKIEQHIYNFESELKKALGYENTRVIGPKDERTN